MFSSELSATQLWYLRKPSKAKIHGILTITFQDLTLRRVLNYSRFHLHPTERSKKTQKYFKFVRGINYQGYEPKNFEKRIVTPFEEYKKLQAKTLTNSALKKYGLPTGFITAEILEPLKKEGYMSSPPLLGVLGMKSITKKGKEIISELNAYLEDKEQLLAEVVDKDREKFIAILEEMQSLIFFTKKDNPELYQQIIANVKWVNQTKPLGVERDLSAFVEAMNIDLSFLDNH